MDLGVGLPANLNDTFGVKEDGTPKTWIFNTYVPDEEDTITRFTVGVSADKEIDLPTGNAALWTGRQGRTNLYL